jgi:hypothetical protein
MRDRDTGTGAGAVTGYLSPPVADLPGMSRANRERIYEAQRAGLRGRIVRAWRQSEHRADELLREWESEAATRGLDRSYPQWWDEAPVWIEGRIVNR